MTGSWPIWAADKRRKKSPSSLYISIAFPLVLIIEVYKELKSSQYICSQIFTLSEVDYICLLYPLPCLACIQDCLTPWSTIEYFEKKKNRKEKKKPFVYNKLFANACTFYAVQGILALKLTCLALGIALGLVLQTMLQGRSWDVSSLP